MGRCFGKGTLKCKLGSSIEPECDIKFDIEQSHLIELDIEIDIETLIELEMQISFN